MKKYIGTRLIEANEMNLGEYNKFKGWTIPEDEDPSKEGYLIKYSDDYITWTPKEIFEKQHLEVCNNPNLKNGISVSSDMVDDFIREIHTSTIGDKTTVVVATLINGFEIVESSSCVDAANYSEEKGAKQCLKKIKDKVWMLLGFLLQTAVGGVEKHEQL